MVKTDDIKIDVMHVHVKSVSDVDSDVQSIDDVVTPGSVNNEIENDVNGLDGTDVDLIDLKVESGHDADLNVTPGRTDKGMADVFCDIFKDSLT